VKLHTPSWRGAQLKRRDNLGKVKRVNLHDEELTNLLYRSPNVVRIGEIWDETVGLTIIGIQGRHIEFWRGNLLGNVHFEDRKDRRIS
jgi:hypothetical protein